MGAALVGIPGTFSCADDVKIQVSTEEKHNIHLLETIQKTTKVGIKFNPSKCQIKKCKIESFARNISHVSPCPKKIKAVVNLASPSSKQELQSFLTTGNFMFAFIANLSRKTYVMRHLLKKDSHFEWISNM